MTSQGDDRRLFANWAMTLFVLGLLVPIVIAALGAEESAVAFGIIAEFLALAFGIIGWRHLAGKVAGIGVVFLLVLVSVNAVFWYNLTAENMREHVEKARQVQLEESQRQDAFQEHAAEEAQPER